MFRKLKETLYRMSVSNVYLYHVVRKNLGRFSFVLPHDEDFLAFKKVGDGDRVILDVGANDGISARSLRKLLPTRPIVSFEPNPLHKPALERVKADISNFDFKLLGAGEAESSLTLCTPVYKGISLTNYASLDRETARINLQNHMRIRNISEKAKFVTSNVEIKPLDDFGFDPAIIKVDVEGFEAPVIRGLLKTISASKPVIMIEYNERSYLEVVEELVPLGYACYQYNKNADCFVPFDEQSSILNVFFIDKSSELMA